jgi:hypothetical protein
MTPVQPRAAFARTAVTLIVCRAAALAAFWWIVP